MNRCFPGSAETRRARPPASTINGDCFGVTFANFGRQRSCMYHKGYVSSHGDQLVAPYLVKTILSYDF